MQIYTLANIIYITNEFDQFKDICKSEFSSLAILKLHKKTHTIGKKGQKNPTVNVDCDETIKFEGTPLRMSP